jgi:hypothetical protein
LIRHARLRSTRTIGPLPITVVEPAFRTLLMTTIGDAMLIATGLAAAMQTAITLSVIATRAEKKRRTAITAQTNPQQQNHFARNRHPPSPAGLDNGYGFVAP